MVSKRIARYPGGKLRNLLTNFFSVFVYFYEPFHKMVFASFTSSALLLSLEFQCHIRATGLQAFFLLRPFNFAHFDSKFLDRSGANYFAS